MDVGWSSEDAEEQELKEQIEVTTERLRKTVRQMLHDGDVHPHILVLAAARLAGELMGALAAESGHDVERRC